MFLSLGLCYSSDWELDKIGLVNGLLPDGHQAITWTNIDIIKCVQQRGISKEKCSWTYKFP